MVNNFAAAQRTAQELEAVTTAIPTRNQKSKQWKNIALNHLELFIDCMRRAEKHEQE